MRRRSLRARLLGDGLARRDLAGHVRLTSWSAGHRSPLNLLGTGRLHWAEGLPEAPATEAELRDFRQGIGQRLRDTYGALAGKHDDLPLALCCACWAGESAWPDAEW